MRRSMIFSTLGQWPTRCERRGEAYLPRGAMSEERNGRRGMPAGGARAPAGRSRRRPAFADRSDAGRQLAELLAPLAREHPILYAIPRGGVPVAAEAVRAPGNPEFAIGALAEGGVCVLSDTAMEALCLTDEDARALLARAGEQLQEQIDRYRSIRPPIPPNGRTAIVVDDGLATGRSALAAVRSLRRRGAGRVLLAVPVAARESLAAIEADTDGVICVEAPVAMRAVGWWYERFGPPSEEQVAALLRPRPSRALLLAWCVRRAASRGCSRADRA